MLNVCGRMFYEYIVQTKRERMRCTETKTQASFRQATLGSDFRRETSKVHECAPTILAVDWLSFLVNIREVPGLYLGPESDYPKSLYSLILSILGKCQNSNFKRVEALPLISNSSFAGTLLFDTRWRFLLRKIIYVNTHLNNSLKPRLLWQSLKQFSQFYGTRRFVIVFTKLCH